MKNFPIRITINNLQKKKKINLMLLKEKAYILEQYIPANIKEISVNLINDKKIIEVNKKFLNKKSHTDIISFKTDQTIDILISIDTAKKQAKEFNNSFEKEIFYLIIHGILHFSGYNDYSINSRNKMLKKQDIILKKIWDNTQTKKNE